MHLMDFIERFPGEKECILYFAEIRKLAGITCSECGGNEHKWLYRRYKFECYNCEARTDIQSGTLMENSNLPMKSWFISIHLMTSAKQIFTESDILRKVGYKDSEPVKEMLEKLRLAGANAENSKNFDSLLFACAKNIIK